jgi:hypothetical protein
MEEVSLPKDQIFVFDDVISDELCDTIKIIFDNSNCTWKEEYGPGSNVIGDTLNVSDLENKSFAKVIDNEIFGVVSNVISKIKNYSNSINMSSDTGYQLRKIKGATRYHTDGALIPNRIKNEKFAKLSKIRSMSIIIALNSDYEGGDLCFPKQNFEIKLKKGQAIAFPPYWTHPHYTMELLNGTVRYTITTWLTE